MFATTEFWIAVALLLFFALVAWKGWKPAMAGLDARRDRIANELEESKRLHDEAQTLLADYQRRQREALKDAEAIVANARAEAERMRVDTEKKMTETFARREQSALDKIAQAESRVLQEVRALAVDVAIDASGKALAGAIDAKKAGSMIDDAIDGLGKKLH
ncbi:MAG: F0F1 ATP synthase subunit B [Pseudomonadota bacterium]